MSTVRPPVHLQLGHVAATPATLDLVPELDIVALLHRHRSGDRGDEVEDYTAERRR